MGTTLSRIAAGHVANAATMTREDVANVLEGGGTREQVDAVRAALHTLYITAYVDESKGMVRACLRLWHDAGWDTRTLTADGRAAKADQW